MDDVQHSPDPPPSQHGRVCFGDGCNRQISSTDLDPHKLCVRCRGGVCTLEHRCDECRAWRDAAVLQAFKHQRSLDAKRRSPKKRSTSLGKSLPEDLVHGTGSHVGSVLSSLSNMDPGPSASQVGTHQSADMQAQLSSVLGNCYDSVCWFLGMSGTDKATCLTDVVKVVLTETSSELPNPL